ncbi:hypothetical protein [Salirhabdus sp. Marseille-P4669]|uniref:hypothetical protein n=1 Tax=Salirhabdus sp. Marseille-P4669 TaxID=2042310 RepID=UPI000C7AB2EF|nr:hypothetical protein [Salirhabdus sp. Marseille-P4669]
MEVIQIRGYQLEKSVATSPEDAFVRSEVIYHLNKEEKTLSLLFLEYFDQKRSEFTPFNDDPIMTIGEIDYTFKDVAALAALLNNPHLSRQKRIYIHDFTHFRDLYENMDWEIVKQALLKISNDSTFHVSIKS